MKMERSGGKRAVQNEMEAVNNNVFAPFPQNASIHLLYHQSLFPVPPLHHCDLSVFSCFSLSPQLFGFLYYSFLFLHQQAWLTEIHEYAQQDVVVMLLGNKVRPCCQCWEMAGWTDGLRGWEGEGPWKEVLWEPECKDRWMPRRTVKELNYV